MKINNAIYDENSEGWWGTDSFLSLLQALNPGRFVYLDQVLADQSISYKDLRVLDIGCGGGFICEEFAERGAQVSGVDPSKPSLAEAAKHAKQMGYEIDYQHGYGEILPFADNSFDLVSCCDVLEHVEDLSLTLKETARVLKPGGIYFYDTIHRTPLSWLVMIKIMQDWPTRMVPENTHVWNMFIKPNELLAHLRASQLQSQDLVGLGPKFGIRSLIEYSKAKKGQIDSKTLGKNIGMGPTKLKSISYMGWAIKK